MIELRQKFCYPERGKRGQKAVRCAKSPVTVVRMDKTMSQQTRNEVLEKLRRRYERAGIKHKRKLLGQAQELFEYHRKSAIIILGSPKPPQGLFIFTGRPGKYEAEKLLPWLRIIWRATDYSCGKRLTAMLSERISV